MNGIPLTITTGNTTTGTRAGNMTITLGNGGSGTGGGFTLTAGQGDGAGGDRRGAAEQPVRNGHGTRPARLVDVRPRPRGHHRRVEGRGADGRAFDQCGRRHHAQIGRAHV